MDGDNIRRMKKATEQNSKEDGMMNFKKAVRIGVVFSFAFGLTLYVAVFTVLLMLRPKLMPM